MLHNTRCLQWWFCLALFYNMQVSWAFSLWVYVTEVTFNIKFHQWFSAFIVTIIMAVHLLNKLLKRWCFEMPAPPQTHHFWGQREQLTGFGDHVGNPPRTTLSTHTHTHAILPPQTNHHTHPAHSLRVLRSTETYLVVVEEALTSTQHSAIPCPRWCRSGGGDFLLRTSCDHPSAC